MKRSERTLYSLQLGEWNRFLKPYPEETLQYLLLHDQNSFCLAYLHYVSEQRCLTPNRAQAKAAEQLIFLDLSNLEESYDQLDPSWSFSLILKFLINFVVPFQPLPSFWLLPFFSVPIWPFLVIFFFLPQTFFFVLLTLKFVISEFSLVHWEENLPYKTMSFVWYYLLRYFDLEEKECVLLWKCWLGHLGNPDRHQEYFAIGSQTKLELEKRIRTVRLVDRLRSLPFLSLLIFF